MNVRAFIAATVPHRVVRRNAYGNNVRALIADAATAPHWPIRGSAYGLLATYPTSMCPPDRVLSPEVEALIAREWCREIDATALLHAGKTLRGVNLRLGHG